MKNKNTVIIASSGDALVFLKSEFKTLKTYNLVDYAIRYSARMNLKMLLQSPKILSAIKTENIETQEIIKKENIDFIISDNRYGCYSKSVRSIFIGHQLSVPTIFLKNTIQKVLANFINHFDECWIPDFSDRRLSGKLSSNPFIKIPNHFIGSLSRFTKNLEIINQQKIVAILSGPEPNRSKLEVEIVEAFSQINKDVVMIRGTTKEFNLNSNQPIQILDLVDSSTLKSILQKASIIISRSGYSSLMDYENLDCKFILIPTKGQPEQEYLAKKWAEKENFSALKMNSNLSDELLKRIHSIQTSIQDSPSYL